LTYFRRSNASISLTKRSGFTSGGFFGMRVGAPFLRSQTYDEWKVTFTEAGEYEFADAFHYTLGTFLVVRVIPVPVVDLCSARNYTLEDLLKWTAALALVVRQLLEVLFFGIHWLWEDSDSKLRKLKTLLSPFFGVAISEVLIVIANKCHFCIPCPHYVAVLAGLVAPAVHVVIEVFQKTVEALRKDDKDDSKSKGEKSQTTKKGKGCCSCFPCSKPAKEPGKSNQIPTIAEDTRVQTCCSCIPCFSQREPVTLLPDKPIIEPIEPPKHL